MVAQLNETGRSVPAVLTSKQLSWDVFRDSWCPEAKMLHTGGARLQARHSRHGRHAPRPSGGGLSLKAVCLKGAGSVPEPAGSRQ